MLVHPIAAHHQTHPHPGYWYQYERLVIRRTRDPQVLVQGGGSSLAVTMSVVLLHSCESFLRKSMAKKSTSLLILLPNTTIHTLLVPSRELDFPATATIRAHIEYRILLVRNA